MPKFQIINDSEPDKNFTVEADTIEEASAKALEELDFWVSRDYEENLEEKELTEIER
jgi:hypothetical protein